MSRSNTVFCLVQIRYVSLYYKFILTKETIYLVSKQIMKNITENRKPEVGVEQNSLELALVFSTSPEEQKKGWCKRELGNGKYIQVQTVVATEDESTNVSLIRDLDISTLLVSFLLLKHATIKPSKYSFETTPYQILRFLGKEDSKENYKALKDSLLRLAGNFVTTNFWWDTINKERTVKKYFHFLGSVGEGEKKSLRISINEDIAKSFEAGYIKYLDEQNLLEILKLQGYAKILALYFLKLIGEKTNFEQKLDTILKLLGKEEKYKTYSVRRFNENVNRVIVPAVKKALEIIGFDCFYNNKERKFYFFKKKEQTKIEPQNTVKNDQINYYHPFNFKELENDYTKEKLTQAMKQIGITENEIKKILSTYPVESVKHWLVCLPYGDFKNPTGAMLNGLKNGYPPPGDVEDKYFSSKRH